MHTEFFDVLSEKLQTEKFYYFMIQKFSFSISTFESKHVIIPIGINNLCTIYYFINEKWDPKAKHKDIIMDGDILQQQEDGFKGVYINQILLFKK